MIHQWMWNNIEEQKTDKESAGQDEKILTGTFFDTD